MLSVRVKWVLEGVISSADIGHVLAFGNAAVLNERYLGGQILLLFNTSLP